MKVYSPSEIASVLQVKESTLRKYCLLLEERGYEFKKNTRGQRFYYDNDVIILKKFITLKDNGMTLEESAEGVVLWHKGGDEDEAYVSLPDTDIENVIERYVSDTEELREMIQKQSEIIMNLSNKIDAQQEYIHGYLVERDQKIMKTLEYNVELQKKNSSESKKKSFWKRLFK